MQFRQHVSFTLCFRNACWICKNTIEEMPHNICHMIVESTSYKSDLNATRESNVRCKKQLSNNTNKTNNEIFKNEISRTVNTNLHIIFYLLKTFLDIAFSVLELLLSRKVPLTCFKTQKKEEMFAPATE